MASGLVAGAIMAAATVASTYMSAQQQKSAARQSKLLQERALAQQEQAYAQQQAATEKQLAAQEKQIAASEQANALQEQSIANAEQETNRANALTARSQSDAPTDMRTNFTGGTGVSNSAYQLGNNNLLGYNDQEDEESDGLSSGGSLFG